MIQESNDRCTAEMKECETVRQQHLVHIGNTLHPSVPISDNEVRGGGRWRRRGREERKRGGGDGEERRGREGARPLVSRHLI